jgi:methionyl-tRNA formyltransferase
VRVVYCGSPADAVPPLDALRAAGHDVALVVTQPDRRRGRGGGVVASPVKEAAARAGLSVRTPARAGELIDEIRALGVDAGVVVAFGQLLPPELLATARHGFVNLHFSLLPRWRGAAPVERAILAGDHETGVCLMELEEGLDTGPVYACARTTIREDESAGELRARLVDLGTTVLLDNLPQVGVRSPVPQVGEPTYAKKLTVDEFRLDPDRAAVDLARLVRAGNPRPGAWLSANGRRLKVLRAHVADGPAEPGVVGRDAHLGTAEGRLALDEVQPEGRRAMSGAEWLAGIHAPRVSVDPG